MVARSVSSRVSITSFIRSRRALTCKYSMTIPSARRSITGALMKARNWWCSALALALVLGKTSANTLRPECGPSANCTYNGEAGVGEFFYDVSGGQVIVNFRDGGHFQLTCNFATLNNPDLPRFSTVVRVSHVTFSKCTPPTNGSFAAAAATLNVTGFSWLTLDTLPVGSELTHDHLAGLQRLTRFELYGTNNASLAPGALASLSIAPTLKTLHLNSVHTPAADLARLPHSLQTLKLWSVDATNVYFDSLPNLTSLDVSERYPVTVNASSAKALQVLSLFSPNTIIPEDALPLNLTTLSVFGWNETKPIPKKHCEKLENLKLTGTNNVRHLLLLPDEWLASCSRLKHLNMYYLPIRGALPARLLANATALQTISMQHCGVTALPQTLFDDTPNLLSLDLSYNNITSLPSGLFLNVKSLNKLNLSHNLLTSAVGESLSGVTSLRELRLNYNAGIGDFCIGGPNFISVQAGTSPLKSLKALQYLYLSHTNVSRVCRDWREDLKNLKWLDLNNTAITILTYEDLKYRRTVNDASVLIGGGGEYELLYQFDDFKHALHEDLDTSIVISGSLVCDCNTYWAALAFHNNPSHSRMLAKPQCNGTPLAKVDLDRLTCSASDDCAGLQGNCTCRKRDDYEHGSVVIMQCVGLTEIPRLPSSKHKWRLHLANNNISHIDAANVSTNIVELDLRNNSITRLDGEAAAKLASVPQLQLAGNPLECGCESYEMLRALLDTSSQLRHLADVRCNGTGQPLTAVKLMPCSVQRRMPVPSSMLPLVVPLVVLLAVAILAYGVIARPATRLWIKIFLMRLGWMPRPFEPADDDRPYDAFISFAHEDEELVVEELAARLESGPQPYRLCLHYRDWAPGEWIPAQIAASVRASRRTVAVVSTHYLQSGWARAEFREATAASLRDGTPRLVVVLLDDPDQLTLEADSELSAYVRHNVYVRWGDPWFWEKMKQALPLPRTLHSKKAPLSSRSVQDMPLPNTHVVRETAPTLVTATAPPSYRPEEPVPRATPCSA